MLGLQALHVKVSKPAVPRYMVTLGNKCNTKARVTHFFRGGAWGELWSVGHEVETVSGGH
jgi:hypothetical protein